MSSLLERIGFPGARTIERNIAAPVRSFGAGIAPGLSNIGNQLRSLRRAAHAQLDPQEAWLQEGERQARLRSTPIGPTRDIYEQPGVGWFDRGSGRFLGRGSSTGISGADIGGDGRGEQYRQQLSQYTPKAFPMTAEGQQERYFGTPELNYVFGAQTGKGPKTAEEMRALAAQTKAPVETPLSDYYRSQSAMGRVNQADIQAMYADRPDLQKWAAANPMLAQREFIKQQGGRPLAPDQQTVMGDLGSRAQSESGYTMEAFGLPANPVVPTEDRSGTGMTQGERMDANRGVSNLQPLQAMKTSGSAMPAFEPTDESLSKRIDAFLYGGGYRQ